MTAEDGCVGSGLTAKTGWRWGGGEAHTQQCDGTRQRKRDIFKRP